MKKGAKFSIKEAQKLYQKMVTVEEKLGMINHSPLRQKKSQMDGWVTTGGSSNFNNKIVSLNSWQIGAKS